MDFESVTVTTVVETFLLLLIGIQVVFGREDPAAGDLAVEGKDPLQLATVPLVLPLSPEPRRDRSSGDGLALQLALNGSPRSASSN